MAGARSVVVACLLLAACTGSPGADPADLAGTAPPGGAADAPATTSGAATEGVAVPPDVVRVQGCEPRSLLPVDAPRQCGQQVTTALFSPLVRLDPDDTRPRWGLAEPGAVAETIGSIDGRRWEITLKEGWQFHDGSPVTAASFVDAWNAAASGDTGVANAFLFEPIQGFEDVHCPEPGCEPAAERMTGLRVLDDLRFEVVLEAPDRNLPRRLGHVAFSPLPPAAFEDPQGFREAPIGNGPFRMEGAWQHDERIALRVVPDHPAAPTDLAGVDLVLVEDGDEAWGALERGELDVATVLPAGAWRRGEAADGLVRIERDGDVQDALVVPTHIEALSTDPRLARALSMAIDRQAIIDRHLDGAARPATGLVPPVVSNEVDRCRATCQFQPGWARSLLAEVDLPEDGIELWVDRDGRHEPWVRAIARQWRRHLGLDPEQVRVRALSHTRWLSHVQDRRVGGPYPIGWSMDVAAAEEYLRELHAAGGLFNLDGFAATDVRARLGQVGRSETPAEARLLLGRIEQDVLAAMHHIPLWVHTHRAVHHPRVEGVALDGRGLVVLEALAVTDEAE